MEATNPIVIFSMMNKTAFADMLILQYEEEVVNIMQFCRENQMKELEDVCKMVLVYWEDEYTEEKRKDLWSAIN